MTAATNVAACDLPDELNILRDQVARFVRESIQPAAERWEADGYVPRDILRRMGDLGFLGLRCPAAYGGSDLPSLASVVFAEELGRSTFSGAAITALVHTDMAAPHLVNAGTEAQRKRWLPDMVAGKLITAIAVTEPGAGSDVSGLRTAAVRDGDHWVLNGSKMFITNGVHAGLVFVAARTDPSVKASRGVTIFAVERGTPGFSVGRRLEKQGWRSSDTAELVFDDCRIPAANIVGEENRGFYAIMKNFQNERLVLGAMMVGECQAMLALTLEHARLRQAFGGALWDLQSIRQKLAMLAARVEAARCLVYATARQDSAGVPCVREVSMVKALCGELVNEVAYACVQVHGGGGFMQESAINRMARDARVQAIGGGATEVMLEQVAKHL
jgi:acyl-CoA dehydrogenase